MTPARVEVLVWVLIYGGLLLVGLGLAVRRVHGPIAATLLVFGGALAAAGVVLIWVRSRMKER